MVENNSQPGHGRAAASAAGTPEPLSGTAALETMRGCGSIGVKGRPQPGLHNPLLPPPYPDPCHARLLGCCCWQAGTHPSPLAQLQEAEPILGEPPFPAAPPSLTSTGSSFSSSRDTKASVSALCVADRS